MNASSSTILALAAALAIGITLPGAAIAQNAMMLEARGGLNVPTFDITDAAEAGGSFGLGVGYQVSPKLYLLADVDYGRHGGASLDGDISGPDIDVAHIMAKVGYDAYTSPDGRFSVLVNAGAGAMTFDVDGGDRFTYPAINVGAKLAYALAPQLAFVLSPQGDIAFTDEDEVGTSNSWVWPFAAGLRFTF